MNRIKDVTQVLLKPEEILLKLVLPSNLIIDPKEGAVLDYAVVVNKGNQVSYEIGDIILEFANIKNAYQFKHMDTYYAIIPYYTVQLAVKPYNFDNKTKTNNLIIN